MKIKVFFSELLRYTIMVAAFFMMSSGMVAMVNAGVGTPPWDVFHLGLSLRIDLSYGQVIQGFGLIMVVVSFFMGVKPRIGTVLNMVFIGIFVDLITTWNLLPRPAQPVFSYLQLVAGILVFAYGTAAYILINRGTGPRDSFMVALARITGLRMGLIRTFIEVTVTAAGFMLGGPLGAGTVIFALTVGFFMEIFLKVGRYQAKLLRFYLGKRRKPVDLKRRTIMRTG